MTIQFNLGLINGLSVDPVPVTVDDASAVFQYHGTLTAVLENALPSTVIQWTQISGAPVTFTSPTDSTVITFTTSDLDRKGFKCCTNPGTGSEVCAYAEFYHFPIGVVDGPNIRKTDMAQAVYNPDYPVSKDLSAAITHGMIPADHRITGYSGVPQPSGGISRLEGDPDAYTELLISLVGTVEGVSRIKGVVIEQFDNGSWVTELVLPKGELLAIGLSATLNERRVSVLMESRGHQWWARRNLGSKANGGASEFVRGFNNSGVVGGIAGIESILQQIRGSGYSQHHKASGGNLAGGISALSTQLQTVSKFSDSDRVKPNTGIMPSALTGITTILQTNLGVT